MGFLVISRRTNERITIGKYIEIMIVDVVGSDRVDIGIKAPKNLDISKKPTRLEEEKHGSDIRDKSRS